jgi:2-oxoglutarate ferredoxin oxidoreductase subunit beta
MRHPEFPEPIGVFRAVDRPIYEQRLHDQIVAAQDKRGDGDLTVLFHSGDTWSVE